MSRVRSINIDAERAFRVVAEYANYTRCYGPYSVLSAAKAKRTTLLNAHPNWGPKEVTIEQTAAGWEKVEV